MNGLNLDNESLIRLLAMNAASDFSDASDDTNYWESDDDDDDDDEESLFFGGAEDDDDDDDDEESLFFADSDLDDDDDDEEGFGLSGNMADTMEERRSRRRRSFRRRRYKSRRSVKRRTPPAKGKSTVMMRSPNGQTLRVGLSTKFATASEVNKRFKAIDKRLLAALKEPKNNFNRLTKQISQATSKLDGRVAKVSKSVKQLEAQAQTQPLMSLLSGNPKIKTIQLMRPQNADPDTDLKANEPLEAVIEYEKDNNILLPLLLGGGLGGGGANNSLLLALAFSNKD